MPTSPSTTQSPRLLRSPLKEDTIPKPCGSGSRQAALKFPSRRYQVFFKLGPGCQTCALVGVLCER